jgi:hypothetical protein
VHVEKTRKFIFFKEKILKAIFGNESDTQVKTSYNKSYASLLVDNFTIESVLKNPLTT